MSRAPVAAARGAPVQPEPYRGREPSSPDFLASEILNGLLAGRYRPGERLAEADLTRAYKVSRGSVREALRRLAAEGVVSLNPYRSAHIRTLSRSELADVLALLEVLAGLAARLAAERIGRDGNRMRLQSALQDPAEAQASDGVAPRRDRFFRALLQVAANRDLIRLLPTLQVHLLAIPAAFEHDIRHIAEAVLAADADAAEAAARRHFQAMAERLRRMPEEAFAADGE